MRHPLTDHYRNERETLLGLGRRLTPAQASGMTAACPDWSIKDVYAHLAGIATDIVTGNVEGAATEPWADGHVADRTSASLADILDEWAEAGDQVSNTMETAGDLFPFQLFLDQWTHGWDIRSALGSSAEAPADDIVTRHVHDDLAQAISAGGKGLARITIDVDGRTFGLGDGARAGRLRLSGFEFGRVAMGRRSAAQLATLPWPVDDPQPYFAEIVVWSVSPHDVIDPVTNAT